MNDSRLAAQIAEEAGQLLLQVRAEAPAHLTPKQLGQRGDKLANEMLLRRLAQLRPDDAVLSEESADSPQRLSSDRVWIIDPLDGSREFGLPDHDDWAVHVALWQRSAGTERAGITAAAVAQPALGAVYADDDAVLAGSGAAGSGPRILVSASRPPVFAAAMAQAVGGELVTMGSAGAKAMAVLRGDAEAYVHAGGQWEWDSAAPVGVVLAAGLHASRVDGSPLRYNEAHPYLPDLLICRPELAQPLLSAIAAAG